MRARIAEPAEETGKAHRGSLILVAGFLLTGSACAVGRGSSGGPMIAPSARPAAVELNVANHYNSPMEIYAVGSGTFYRMGTVLPGLSSHFVLRQGMIIGGPVEFVAQANDRQAPVRSDRLLLAPGNVVDFEISTNLMISTATVRR